MNLEKNWYRFAAEEVLAELQSDVARGLSAEKARVRLVEFGPNALEDRDQKSPWTIFFNQFREVMILVLIGAAIVSGLLGEYTDVVVILAIVFLNAVLGFSQEYRAEQAMAALKELAVPTVRVRRDGSILEISSTEVVPGDIIILEAGNLLPADGRLVKNVNVKIDESALTGESEPVEKDVAALDEPNLVLGDQVNMLFMGTVVTYGRAEYVVTATGMQTELGKIAGMLQETGDEQTPLQRRLAQLGTRLAWVALAIILLVVGLGLLRGDDLETLFLTGIGLAVAVIPESLPAVVTITLALGSQRLLKRNALIRRLPAVETLGSVTVVCSDKTGTLTENRMTVTLLDVAGNTHDLEALVDRKGTLLEADFAADMPGELNALSVLVRAGALCNDAILTADPSGEVRAVGDPTEGALILAAAKLGYDMDELRAQWPRISEVPFTSERKRMTTVHQMNPEMQQTDLPWREMPYLLLTKGAVDTILPISSWAMVDNEMVELDNTVEQRILAANASLAGQGQRVLAVAFGFWDTEDLPADEGELEANRVFVGLIAMMDPPRPEVEEAVLTARTAGIRPIMITGDHPLTALRIARDLHIADNDRYLTGVELAEMSLKELEAVVEDVSVYARVAPEHKLNIVEALQDKGEIVAMTGDGVNDAPALKRADIGVAMGITGTDVSKQAADTVLLDDNFATIVAAVEEGRVIFDNIRKFIKYTLSSNTGELMVMLLGPFFGMPLPLLPLQILWINLVTDGLPGLALAIEPGEPGVMQRKPYAPRESVFSRGIGPEIVGIGGLMGVISLGVGLLYWLTDPSGPWQTMIFMTLTMAQMGNALATRSNRQSFFSMGLFTNRLMVLAVTITFLLQLALIYIPFLQRVFGTRSLSLPDLGVSLLASATVFFAVELYKWLMRVRGRRHDPI